jgi:hypothetical protein
MSLSRLYTRALACVALQQQVDDAVSPTMADDRVFDSRLDPLLFKAFDTPMPGIIVYTDDDEGDLINRGSGSGPFRRWVDLRVELVIGSFNSEVIDNEQQVVFDLPMTDAQLEAQLDLFEQQVKWALWSLPNRIYSHAFRQYVIRIESIKSHATRDESGNNRFASRRMHFKLEIPDDCPPDWLGLQPGQTPPANIPFCADLSKFPAPWITPMLQAMCNQPSMKNVLDVLAGTGNPYHYAPLLRRIGVNVTPAEQAPDDKHVEVRKLLEIP